MAELHDVQIAIGDALNDNTDSGMPVQWVVICDVARPNSSRELRVITSPYLPIWVARGMIDSSLQDFHQQWSEIPVTVADPDDDNDEEEEE